MPESPVAKTPVAANEVDENVDVEAQYDPKSKGEQPGYLPEAYHTNAWNAIFGFAIVYLAGLASTYTFKAMESHRDSVFPPTWAKDTDPVTVAAKEYLWKLNIVFGAFFTANCTFALFAPFSMFFGLFNNEDPAPRSCGKMCQRNMLLLFLAIEISALLLPNSRGVGVVQMIAFGLFSFNLFIACFFGHYTGRKNTLLGKISWFFYLATGVLATGFFADALVQNHAFDNLDGSQGINDFGKNGERKWLWYLNTTFGAMYCVCGLLIALPSTDTWFFSFYFSKVPAFVPQSIDQFFTRSFGLILFGVNVCQMARPSCTGLGLIAFFANAFYFVHFAAVVGLNTYDIANRFTLWPFYNVSTTVFTILFGIALHKAGITTSPYQAW